MINTNKILSYLNEATSSAKDKKIAHNSEKKFKKYVVDMAKKYNGQIYVDKEKDDLAVKWKYDDDFKDKEGRNEDAKAFWYLFRDWEKFKSQRDDNDDLVFPQLNSIVSFYPLTKVFWEEEKDAKSSSGTTRNHYTAVVFYHFGQRV